jgi:hypothetical protein
MLARAQLAGANLWLVSIATSGKEGNWPQVGASNLLSARSSKEVDVYSMLKISAMFRIHRYIYYRFYRSQRRAYGEDNSPAYTAMLCVALLISANLSCLLFLILDGILGLQIFASLDKVKIVGAVSAIAAIVYSYFSLMKKYKDIVAFYANESKQERKSRTWHILLYCIATLLLLILVVIYPSHPDS